nr:ATP-binding cassette domain-containing protein [Kofleriaceae bacterium]
MGDNAVEIRGLEFGYRGAPQKVLRGLDLDIARGARVLMIGANGAGKTTLMRVIAGKHMVSAEHVRVLGTSPFHDPSLSDRIEMLGGRFPFEVDLRVSEMLDRAIDVDPARVAHLVDVLGVDRDWRMHAVSDGQRRRVQLLLGLMRPRDVLLLDEISTDLDLIARSDLLAFLRAETESPRRTTLIYATHIFDTLDEWATDLVYVVAGKVRVASRIGDITELADLARTHTAPLVHLVERWLRRDQRVGFL